MKLFVFVDTLLDELTGDQKNSCPGEGFFESIACDLETPYSLGLHLGFKLEEVEEFADYNSQSLPAQVLKMLCTWRRTNGIEATFLKLLQAMQESRIPEQCYKQAVLQYFKDHD